MNLKFRAILFVLIVFSSLSVIGCGSEPKVCSENTCFSVEVVSTPQTRMTGLMHREHLDKDKGMLFVFDKPDKYYFWMKNTLIPLDIIWMDEHKKIIYINKNTPPCEEDHCPSYGPDEKSIYVLEINGGLSDEKDINTGDILTFKAIAPLIASS